MHVWFSMLQLTLAGKSIADMAIAHHKRPHNIRIKHMS